MDLSKFPIEIQSFIFEKYLLQFRFKEYLVHIIKTIVFKCGIPSFIIASKKVFKMLSSVNDPFFIKFHTFAKLNIKKLNYEFEFATYHSLNDILFQIQYLHLRKDSDDLEWLNVKLSNDFMCTIQVPIHSPDIYASWPVFNS